MGAGAVWAAVRMRSPWPSGEIQLLLLACTLGPAILGPSDGFQCVQKRQKHAQRMWNTTISAYLSILTSLNIFYKRFEEMSEGEKLKKHLLGKA